MADPAAAPGPDHSRDGESRVKEIIAILSVFSLLSTFVVALRVWTRARILRSFGIDDAVIVVAQTLTIGAAVAEGLEGKWGLGTHTWVQPKEDFVPFMKSFYVSIILYNIALCLIKISILLQYRRIFTQKVTQHISLVCLCFLGAWTVTLAFLLPMVCWPVSAFWGGQGRCVNQLAVWYVMAGVNIVTDFTIFGIPLPVIKSLQLPTKQKVLLVMVFGLGLFTCIVSILRIRTLHTAAQTEDPNWDNTDAALWSFIELCVGILTSSLPTLRPILAALMPRYFSSRATGRGYQQYDLKGGYSPGSMATARRTMPSSKAATSAVRTTTDSTEELNHDLELGLTEFDHQAQAAYSVNVTGGRRSRSFDPPTPSRSEFPPMPNGITTTTTVTYEVSEAKGV